MLHTSPTVLLCFSNGRLPSSKNIQKSFKFFEIKFLLNFEDVYFGLHHVRRARQLLTPSSSSFYQILNGVSSTPAFWVGQNPEELRRTVTELQKVCVCVCVCVCV
jgi:hypothetical protein